VAAEEVVGFAGLSIPQSDRLVVAAAGEGMAVGTDGQGQDPVFVAGEGAVGVGLGEGPEFDGPILTAAGKDGSALGTAVGLGDEEDAVNPISVAFEGAVQFAAVDIPKPNGLVVAGTGENAAVGADGDGSYPASVTV